MRRQHGWPSPLSGLNFQGGTPCSSPWWQRLQQRWEGSPWRSSLTGSYERKLLSDAHRKNIDIVKERLEKRAVLTLSVFLFYALSPLPSNFLFIAYGLTGLPLLRIALPFFIGRTASYSFFILSGAAAGRRFSHRFDRVGVLRERMVHRLPSCSLRRGLRIHASRLEDFVLMSTGSCGYPNQAPQPMSAINAWSEGNAAAVSRHNAWKWEQYRERA